MTAETLFEADESTPIASVVDHMWRAVSVFTRCDLKPLAIVFPDFLGPSCKWYFWDETWAQFLGPYDNEFQAKQASDEYFQVYLQTGVYTDLLKNKDWHDGEELKGQSFKIING